MLNEFLKEASYAELKRKQERMENMEAKNLPNGRTLTTNLNRSSIGCSGVLTGGDIYEGLRTDCERLCDFSVFEGMAFCFSDGRGELYTEYGMPSSHAQFVSFFTVYLALFLFIRFVLLFSPISKKYSCLLIM